MFLVPIEDVGSRLGVGFVHIDKTKQSLTDLLAEYDGKNVVLITNTNVSMARTRHIWGNYRSKVMAVYGDPYYCGGYGRVMTKERAQHYYRGENILIIDDCDF